VAPPTDSGARGGPRRNSHLRNRWPQTERRRTTARPSLDRNCQRYALLANGPLRPEALGPNMESVERSEEHFRQPQMSSLRPELRTKTNGTTSLCVTIGSRGRIPARREQKGEEE
jgi:hypothetical protein